MDQTEQVECEIDLFHAVQYGRWMIQTGGFWPPELSKCETSWQKFKLKLPSRFSFCMTASLTILSVVDLLCNARDFSHATSNAMLTLLEIAAMFKMFTFMRHRSEILSLLKCMQSIVAPKHLEPHVFKMKKDCESIPKLTILFFAYVCLVAVPVFFLHSYIISTFFSANEYEEEQLKLPIQIWHPFDFKENPKAYIAVYVYDILAILPASFLTTGCDGFYVTLAVIARKMLDHLDASLRDLHWPVAATKSGAGPFRLRPTVLDEAYQAHVRTTLVYCIQHHQRIIRFIAIMNKIYSSVMLKIVWLVLIVMCLTALEITSVNVSLIRMSAILQIFVVQFFTISMLCYSSNDVILKSNIVKRTCCDTAWWTWNESNRTLLQIMILRSNHPLHLTAGGFFWISLDTFLTLFGVSVSYFTFIYQIHKRKA